MKRCVSIPDLRRFILAKQGLSGPCRFSGKAGALSYIRQAGCIQFDPIDICGRNAELTLQSRVKGVKKQERIRKDSLLLFLFRRYQNRPEMTPFSSTSIRSAAGTLGRPGMVMMSPV